MITIENPLNAADLLASAKSWLLESELENNLLLGVLARFAGAANSDPGYLAIVRRQGEIRGVVVETPLNLLVTDLPADGFEVLVGDMDGRIDEMPRIFGPRRTAERLAAAWSRRRRLTAVPKIYSKLYVLGELRPPDPPIAGELRPATETDLPLAISWLAAFIAEAVPASVNVEALAKRLIEEHDLAFWHHGREVAMGGVSGRTDHGVRLAWIYTPPEFRGRGYASAVTAALSQRLSALGAGFLCLYADIANPVSNRLYQRLGYRPVADAAELGFEP